MTIQDDELRPEEFAQAALEAIADAQTHGLRDAAQVLAQAGLAGVCACEHDGGLGLGIEFALPIVHAAGKLQLRFPLPEQILLARAFAGTPQAEALASGAKIATIAWQGELRDGTAGHARQANDCDWVLVADGDGAALLDVSTLHVVTDGALDPETPQVWLDLHGAEVLARLDSESCAVLHHEARLLMAELANGAAEGALEAAATYMATRVQFGRPLSAKQAVRHLLARMRLLQEVSSAAIRRAMTSDEFGAARCARPALAGAIANAAFVIEKAIHLHGGMGFTWELPLHYSLREVRKLDAAFGAGALAHDIGREFIARV